MIGEAVVPVDLVDLICVVEDVPVDRVDSTVAVVDCSPVDDVSLDIVDPS